LMIACMKILLIMLLLCFCPLLSGCDPVTRHKTISVIFEGVPSCPPAEDICSDYYTQRVAADLAALTAAAGEKTALVVASTHLPYGEKRCNDCHSQEKDQNDGLVRSKRELCFVCHKDFIKGAFVHGPVAIGECLACHLPHTSTNPALLKGDKDKLCESCHSEKRVAAGMHNRFVAKQMVCVDCHDPHSGADHFFLK